jgi:hypothetical protein
MNRISTRISNAISGVKCPACEKHVTPIFVAGEEGAESQEQLEGRWSFVWRPPSGEICPECNFPLARYARRAKWMRLFGAGVALLTIAFLLHVLGKMTTFPSWYGWVPRTFATVGSVAFLVGLIGLIVGGRRSGGAETAPPRG